jgi:hypothetical protein
VIGCKKRNVRAFIIHNSKKSFWDGLIILRARDRLAWVTHWVHPNPRCSWVTQPAPNQHVGWVNPTQPSPITATDQSSSFACIIPHTNCARREIRYSKRRQFMYALRRVPGPAYSPASFQELAALSNHPRPSPIHLLVSQPTDVP